MRRISPARRHNLMFAALAPYYDLFFAAQGKDYAAEAARLTAIISRRRRQHGGTLLDLACGTGLHLRHLRNAFRCYGIDRNPAMLRRARDNAPGAILRCGSMTSFRLPEPCDVIICLFCAIAYVQTPASLRRTLQQCAAALRPGGLLLIEPWITRRQFHLLTPRQLDVQQQGVSIRRCTTYRLAGATTRIAFHYRLRQPGRPERCFAEMQVLGLFSRQLMLQSMRDAGFYAGYDAACFGPRGLYIGTRRR